MGKAAGAVAAVFALGGGALSLAGTAMGSHAEAIALMLIGAGLIGSSRWLGVPAKGVQSKLGDVLP